MKQITRLLSTAFFGVLFASGLQAKNLALGKACQYEPAPNYHLCVSDTDALELTDGKLCPDAEKTIWIQRECVGWDAIKKPIRVTVDLGTETLLDHVKLFTGAGISDVRFPSFVDVEVSLDGNEYRTLGCLTTLSKNPLPHPDLGYQKMVFDAEFQPVSARFLRLRVISAGQYFFAEELEIDRTTELDPVPFTDLAVAESDDEMLKQLDGRLVSDCLRRRLDMDWDIVSAQMKALKDIPQEFLQKQKQLRDDIRHADLRALPADFRAVTPMHPLQRTLLAWHGEVMRSLGYSDVTIWTQDRFSSLSPYALPPAKESIMELDAYMMNGEKRGAVLQFTNASAEDMAVTLSGDGVPGEVCYVEFVDSNAMKTDAIGILPLNGTVAVPSGMTRQFYLRLAPKGLKPGVNKIPLNFTWGAGKKQTVTLNLRISKVTFPEKMTLSSGWWDYLDFNAERDNSWNLTKKHLPLALAFEKAMGGSTTFCEHGIGVVNHPDAIAIDENGNLRQPMDFTLFDNWTAQWPDAQNYVIFMGLNVNSTFGGAAPGTPRFNNAIAQWARQWEEHLLARKLAPERVILQMLDEPNDEITWQRTKEWTEGVRKGSRRLSLFVNPLKITGDVLGILKNVDIICPMAGLLLEGSEDQLEFYRQHVASGKKLWTYYCYAGPFNTTPWYYRRQAWLCFSKDATGSLFWSLGSTSDCADAWNQYRVRNIYYSPLIVTPDSMTATKHWEAASEALEDYEYMVILRKKLARDKSSKGKAVLLDTVNKVVGKYETPDGNLAAEKTRLMILAEIDKRTK